MTTASATFTKLANAQSFLWNMKHPTILILAEGSKVIVPYTWKEANRLLALGYQRGD